MSEDKKNKCDHVGQWRAGGMAVLNGQNGAVYLVQVLFCKKCGTNSVQIHSVTQNQTEGTKIAKP